MMCRNLSEFGGMFNLNETNHKVAELVWTKFELISCSVIRLLIIQTLVYVLMPSYKLACTCRWNLWVLLFIKWGISRYHPSQYTLELISHELLLYSPVTLMIKYPGWHSNWTITCHVLQKLSYYIVVSTHLMINDRFIEMMQINLARPSTSTAYKLNYCNAHEHCSIYWALGPVMYVLSRPWQGCEENGLGLVNRSR